MKKLFENHFIFFDTVKGLILTALVFTVFKYAGWFKYVRFVTEGVKYDSLYATLAQVIVSLLGFVIAAAAITCSFTGAELMKKLKETQYYSQIIESYFSASRWLCVALLFCLGLLAYSNPSNQPAWAPLFVLGSMVLVSIKVWRTLSILRLIYSNN